VVRSLIQEGKLRALAVTSTQRQRDFPEVPTMVEAGVPDYAVTSFFGVVAPAGTPGPIIIKLNGAINDALKTELLRTSLRNIGAEPSIETPERFSAFIATELQKWTAIANAAGIRTD
jgi:tripartite-type tricarboxylate transporter receptor subunit TctC